MCLIVIVLQLEQQRYEMSQQQQVDNRDLLKAQEALTKKTARVTRLKAGKS